MFTFRTVPLFLSILVGLVLGVLIWGYLHLRGRRDAAAMLATTDQVLAGLALLAVFALGAFLTYALLSWLAP